MDNKTIYHENKEFKSIDYSEKTLRDREFAKCTFISCNFTNSDLRDNNFDDCVFENCNFSMTLIGNVGLSNVVFSNCKILGVDFSKCSKFMFSFNFDNCMLDYSIFFGSKLKGTSYKRCSLREVDFSESNLTSVNFQEADLTGARFSNTVLEKADFRNARNFSIDPEFNKMKNAKFSAHQLEGLLHKYKLDIKN